MNPEEQAIALAEACPNVFVRPTGSLSWNYRSSVAGRVLPCIDGSPLKDMNAIHEIELRLNHDEWRIYLGFLNHKRVVIPTLMSMEEFHQCWNATAAQRAEAFLKTIGRWKDGAV